MKHRDIILESLATGLLWLLTNVDKAAATVAGLLTVGIIAIRLRKEWRHRND